ncbi:MAG: peptide chain release factor 1 [Bacillota bacterium]|nr:peptide chain release factor 1 [Bacillota bacterium]
MLERLEAVVARYEELSRLLCEPDVVNDPEKLRTYAKEQADLEETVTTYRAYKRVCEELAEAKAMLEEKLDDELRALVKEEIAALSEQKEALEAQLKVLLLPKDPNDEKNVIVEIRAAAGGEESALFAADLFRMYTRYAERKGYRTEILEAHPTDLGGFKEVIFTVQGRGAYSRLKFESGAHRVQRVPVTESGGRIHTSTATVAVLPEMEEVEVEIDEKDLRIDTFCASGHGGQHVNKTESAVRITHLPTGIVVSCQDEKSQIKNREKAMRVLRARVYEFYRKQREAELADARKSLVGTGERSERIRTYNFPQNRVTDHRIGLTLHKLDLVLDGDLDEIIDALIVHEQAELLKKAE